MKFDCGKDELTGKTITKSKTYSNVAPDISDDAVHKVALALAGLQNNTLIEVAKIDNKTLSN